MDVSKWPLDKIMQLPDCCFGRRWWIGTYIGTAGGALTYFTIEERLPDRFVIWSMLVQGCDWTAGTGIDLTIRLAYKGFDNDSFWKARRLFHQIALEELTYDFYLTTKNNFYMPYCRSVHESQGLRICGAYKIRNETATCENQIALLISAVPREVPDWLFSGRAAMLS